MAVRWQGLTTEKTHKRLGGRQDVYKLLLRQP